MTQPLETARDHADPVGLQFSLFLTNRVGQLRDVLAILAQENVTVLGLSVVDSTDWAVLRIVLGEPDRARAVLVRHAMAFTESPVILPVLSGPDALQDICSLLLEIEVNVHFAYPLMITHEGSTVMVLHVEDTVLATQVLIRHAVTLLGQEDLADPK